MKRKKHHDLLSLTGCFKNKSKKQPIEKTMKEEKKIAREMYYKGKK